MSSIPRENVHGALFFYFFITKNFNFTYLFILQTSFAGLSTTVFTAGTGKFAAGTEISRRSPANLARSRKIEGDPRKNQHGKRGQDSNPFSF